MRFALRVAAVAGLGVLFGCNQDTHPQSQAKTDTNAKAPLFSCYRHIYNNSSCPWTFTLPQATQYGNVYFGDGTLPNCTSPNGPCTIAGNTSVEIQYTTTYGTAQGVWTIADQNGKSNQYFYSSDVGQCPYIQHSGSTGSIALNDPANGDIHAWGACTW